MGSLRACCSQQREKGPSCQRSIDEGDATGHSPGPRPERAASENPTCVDPMVDPKENGQVTGFHTLARPEHQWGGPEEAGAYEEDEKGEARGAALHLVVENIE